MNNIDIGYSNKFVSLDEKMFSAYKLKVRDAHSMIYINGPVVTDGQSFALAEYVINMLNRLGDLVTYPDGTSFNSRAKELNKVENLGNRINMILAKTKNIPNKFMLTDEAFLMEDNLRFEKEEYDLIKEYITTYGWKDTSVINPASFDAFTDAFGSGEKAPYSMLKISGTLRTPQSSFAPHKNSKSGIQNLNTQNLNTNVLLSLYKMCPPIIKGVDCEQPNIGGAPPPRRTRKHEKDSETDIVLDTFGSKDDEPPFHKARVKFQPQFVDYSLLLQERAPININTAPREILIVTFENLKGWFFDRKQRTFVNPGRYKETPLIDLSQAIRLADHVIAYRRKQPFTNWNQFERFIKGLESDTNFDSKYIIPGGLDTKLSFLSEYQKQVVIANANPNTRMGDFNPDATYDAFFVDYISKDKLLYYTTEFTFSSMGYYEIESVGFVAKKINPAVRSQVVPVEILTEYSLTYDVRLFEVYRHTNQRDFVAESVQWIDGKKVIVKSRPSTSLVVSYPENLTNLGKVEISEGEYRLRLPANAPAGFDGYLSIAPKTEDISSTGNLYSFYNSFTKSFEPEVAEYRSDISEIRGQADEKRSVIDTYMGKGIFPPARLPLPGYGINIAHLTRSTLYNDGYFAHESLRYPYEYNPDPNAKYGWSSKGSRRVIDEYLGYPEGKGEEESGKWNIGKTGAIEFWFKPTWDLYEQKDSDKDTRTLFSVGDAEGVWEETGIEPEQASSPGGMSRGLHACRRWDADYPTLTYIKKFSLNVPYGDPVIINAMVNAYRVTKIIGEEILFPKPDEWSKWESLKAYVEHRRTSNFIPDYAARRSEEAAKRITELMYYQSDDVQQKVEERYREIMNIGFPEERLVIFARNRRIAAFIGNNYTEESGIDDFGNFKSAAVPLFKEDWKRGSWHHILLVWTPTSQDETEEVEVTLYVDGRKSVNPYKTTPSI